MGVNLFQGIFELVDIVLATFIFDAAGKIITFIAPIFNSLMIIWIAIWGYLAMMGQTNEPLKDGVFRILRIGFILTLGLTLGTYLGVTVNFLSKGPEQIAAVITEAPSGSIALSLDQLYCKVFGIVAYCWDTASIWDGNFGMYLLGFGFLIVGTLLLLAIAVFLMSAKVMTAVLLGIGPLFIILILFKGTQRFFEGWLNQLCNYGMILILTAALGMLTLQLAEGFMAKFGMPSGAISEKEAYLAATAMSTLANLTMLSIIFVLCFVLVQQIPSMASALGGGIALGTSAIIGKAMATMSPSSIMRAGHAVRRSARSARSGGRTIGRGMQSFRKTFGSGNSIGAG
jgi:type IV secretion system protein VirB6